MKDRDVRMRMATKAGEVKRHDVIECAGQRIRCDRICRRPKGMVQFTQLYGSGRIRHVHLNYRRKVEVVRRG